MLDRTKAPSTGQIEKIELQKPEIITLDNGVKVYSFSGLTQDVVKIELLFKAGRWYEAKHLVSAVTNKQMGEGTNKYNAAELHDRIDFYGSYYQTDTNKDNASLELYSLNRNLEHTLPYFKEILTDPVFPEQELQLYVQNRKQKMVVNNERVEHIARKRFNNQLFGSAHPYGFFAETVDLDNLSVADLKSFYQEYYTKANFDIIVSGNVTPDILRLINQYIGTNEWKSATTSTIPQYTPMVSSEKKLYIEKTDALQSAIRIGKPLFTRKHPDYIKMIVVNTILGGYFGSRLMSNIREDKGYTYGIHSGLSSLVHEGFFVISTEVGADVCSKAVNEIYFELKRLRTELVPQEELDLVKNYLLGTFLRSIDGPFEQSDRFRMLHIQGLDYEYYTKYFNTIKSITPTEIQSLANLYLHEDSMLEVVVGKK